MTGNGFRKSERVFVEGLKHTHLDQQRISKSQGALQVLSEGVIQEAGSGDLAIFVLIHDKLCGLARWINDERVPVVWVKSNK